MKVADSFALSLNSIVHRRLRSWLTLLGIIIGVAAVVAIISIGEGAQASVTQQLSSFGADIITVTPGFSRAQGFGGGFRGGGGGVSMTTTASTDEAPTLTKKDAIIIDTHPYVTAVTEIVSGRAEIIFLGETTNVSLQGVNPVTWTQTSNLTLSAGRFLTPSDSVGVVIGTNVATTVFKQPITLGRTITLEGKPFTVVGILSPSGSGFGQGDSTVYTTLNGAWNVLSDDVNRDTYTSIQAKVSDSEQVDQTVNDLTASLQISRRVTERNQDFTVTSSQALQEQVSAITGTLTLFLGAIAAISLIVGALGVANSMFTSVLEKTKEIGILKALGSTNNEILTLFVMESGLFGLVGGIIGVILGTLASVGVSSTGLLSVPGGQGSTIFVSPELIIIAITLSTIIGIIAGLVPAMNASRLRPIEALRYE
ncbi:MAG: ABC transporter permease [Candidatus Diapherotrites archaeon]|nr:ABC transporter permease [Candidatus Diapherotrites archaeon]